jgi:glycosyltransferase involved in cell wall biosynthesis
MNHGRHLEDRALCISVVAPVYNEEGCLSELCSRIEKTFQRSDHLIEIVFVNDGSSDKSLEILRGLAIEKSNITLVNLTRNFGKEVAMTAGLAHSSGDAVIVIDSDLQHPPEVMLEMIHLWEDGYDVVYGERASRASESSLDRYSSSAFYWLLGKIGRVRIPANVGDFRLMDRRVVNAVLQCPETHRFMKGLFAWVGFRQIGIHYEIDPRVQGRTKFSFWKLWNFALEGITSFTIMPLKLSSYLGLLVALGSLSYALYTTIKTILFGDPVQGYTTLIVSILFLGGVQLIVLGILGEYLGRVFNETKRRPLYIVESVHWSGAAGVNASGNCAAPAH